MRFLRGCLRRRNSVLQQFPKRISNRQRSDLTWKVFPQPHPSDHVETDSSATSVPTKATSIDLPKSILIIRHGESLGNENEAIYSTTADWKIPLSDRGRQQSRLAGARLAQLIGDPTTPILYYVSPYLRTKQTLKELKLPNPVWYTREEPRLREQDFGNFQDMRQIRQAKKERPKFGRFFFRFPNGGESGADVFDRVSAFAGTFQRDMQQLGAEEARRSAAIFVTHGITSRLFVMKWLHWSVDDFETLYNPPNCGILHLQMTKSHGYQLSEASRHLIRGPKPHWTGLGKGLQLGEMLQERRREQGLFSIEERRAFDSMPDSARGL